MRWHLYARGLATRSDEALRRVVSLEGPIASMVQVIHEERRSREVIALVAVGRVNRVRREALLGAIGNRSLCRMVDRESSQFPENGVKIHEPSCAVWGNTLRGPLLRE